MSDSKIVEVRFGDNGKIERQFVDGPEAARFLGVSKATISNLVASGQLPVKRYGRAIRIPLPALEEFANDRQSA